MVVFVVALIAPLLFAIGAFFRGVLGACFGALAGWFLGLFSVGGWVLSAAVSFGYGGDLVELGALLAFAGGFLSTSVSHSKD